MAENDETQDDETTTIRASLCVAEDQLFSATSADMIGKFLGGFLDQIVLTPTELLHSARHQKRLNDAGRTLSNAIDKIATLQAKKLGLGNSGARLKELDALVSAAMRRAWAEERERPISAPADAGALAIAMKRAAASPNERDAERLLAEALSRHKTWGDKTEALLRLIEAAKENGAEQALRSATRILSECVLSEACLDRILGPADRMEDRCLAIADACKGNLSESRERHQAAIGISKLVSKKTWEADEIATALGRSAVKILVGKERLRSADPINELRAIDSVAAALLDDGREIGGRRAVEALERRVARILSPEMIEDFSHERKTISEKISAIAVEILPLTRGTTGTNAVTAFLSRLILDQDFAPRILGAQDSPILRLRRLVATRNAVAASGMEPDAKESLVSALETTHAALLVKSKLVETVIAQNPSPGTRAPALMELISSESLMEGRALDEVKENIRACVMHASFAAEFMAKAEPEEKIRAMRDFARTISSIMPRRENAAI